MKNNDQDEKPVGILLHLAAIVGGMVMMVLGVGQSVTMVLLPIGIPLGLIGLGVFIWGLTHGNATVVEQLSQFETVGRRCIAWADRLIGRHRHSKTGVC